MERSPASSLAAQWREDAERLRTWGCDGQATILERCADQLDAHAATVAAETLSLDEAAAASGYSVAHPVASSPEACWTMWARMGSPPCASKTSRTSRGDNASPCPSACCRL